MKSVLQISLGIALGLSLYAAGEFALKTGFLHLALEAAQDAFRQSALYSEPVETNNEKTENIRRCQIEAARRAAREREWRNYFTPAPECNAKEVDWDTMKECANRYIRARRAFDESR